MISNICYVCNLEFKNVFREDINNKKKVLLSIFKKLNEDVTEKICSYLFHYNHDIIHRQKSNNSEFYWTERMSICSKCFHKGIMLSIIRYNRLPRKYVWEGALFYCKEKNQSKKELEIIKNSYGKNFYPNSYNMSMSRSSQILKNGSFYVKSN